MLFPYVRAASLQTLQRKKRNMQEIIVHDILEDSRASFSPVSREKLQKKMENQLNNLIEKKPQIFSKNYFYCL